MLDPQKHQHAKPSEATARSSHAGAWAGTFLTGDPATQSVLDLLDRVADTDASVLVCGESGTGKELLARGVFEKSSRSGGPWVSMNCGAVPAGLHESELFGHHRGAFTGADRRRIGRFEAADGGTIFLDEISEMPKSQQVGLLRVLQSGEYTPVGGAEARVCDVRIISASNRSLPEMVRRGAFRRDLYYRLNVIEVHVPPLRERPDDIPLLVTHLLEVCCRQYRREVVAANSFIDALMAREFPGNVRELENVIRRAVLVGRSSTLTHADVLEDNVGMDLDPDLGPEPDLDVVAAAAPQAFHEAKKRVVEEFERGFLTDALRWSGGIVSRAAEASGLSERNFHAKLRHYGMTGSRFRSGRIAR